MSERIESWLARLRGSLWFVPSLMTVAAVLLSVLTVWIDETLFEDLPSNWFLFNASSEGARSILSTIAGSVITVTGVVFSMTIVALQLASSQYTPRVLRTFTDNRPTQIVMGIFIATFTYSLLVLRAVRSEVDDYDRFVPGISVTLSVMLALCSIGALIFFVNHIAHSIRVETVLMRITADVGLRIDDLFPEDLGEPAGPGGLPDGTSRDEKGWTIHPILARSSGYLQQVDEDALFELAEKHDLVVRMILPIGSFVIEGDPIATATAKGVEGDVARDLQKVFHLGSERTLYQDVLRGIIELTDIGLRALSPSLNDPTTAIGSIDRLTQLLHMLVQRRFPSRFRMGEDGKVRLVALRPDFEEMVRLPYAQIRGAGAAYPVVAHRLFDSLRRVAEVAPPDRLAPLVAEVRELLEAVRRSVDSRADLGRLERVGSEALDAMLAAAPDRAGLEGRQGAG